MRPEVAALYESSPGVSRVHVASLGRDYDLARITLAQAAELVAAGCPRIWRKPVATKAARPARKATNAKIPSQKNAGLTEATASPAEDKN